MIPLEQLTEGVNVFQFSAFHDYHLAEVDIDPGLLKPGLNHVRVHSRYHGHTLEINWPGPALLLESLRD